MKNLDIIKVVILMSQYYPNAYSIIGILYLEESNYLITTTLSEKFVVDVESETITKNT